MTTVSLPDIVFIGKAGAGKTTCAELLVKHFGYEKLSFAEPLKVMLDTQTDRARLQEFGTDVVRAYEPDAWVRLFLWARDIRESMAVERCPGITVDDARFVNEVTRLKADGFIIVRVVAPTTMRVDRLKRNGKLTDEAQLNHSSETELDDFPHDYRIVNDGWPDSLLAELTRIVNAEQLR